MEIPKLDDLNKNTIREKYISIHFSEFHKYITEHYPSDLKWTEKLYWYYNNLTERPVCIVCGNPVRFVNIKEGYKQYCSLQCSYKSDVMKEKRKHTCIERYGVDNPTKNRVFVEKSMKTQRQRYGGVGFESKELMDKTKQTNLERHGVEYIGQSKEVKEKIKQTCLEKYGVEYSFAADKVKEKIKQTNLKRYGVENPGWTGESQEKIHKTNLDKFGVGNAAQSEEIKEKIRQTNLERYGVDNPFASDGIKEKIKQTLINKYGVDHPLKSKEIMGKIIQSKREHHTFNTSSIEESFATWLDSQNISYIRQYRSEDYPFNCDFYFPDKDLYLEIQGFWSHGFHPFDSSNPGDVSIVNEWKEKNTDFYNNAIQVWTKSDPLKRETARKNNLNWIEVFSDDLDEVIKTYKESLT